MSAHLTEEESSSSASHQEVQVVDFQDENKYFGKTRIAKEDTEIDSEEESILAMRNVHKTYLLGIEGVPALR